MDDDNSYIKWCVFAWMSFGLIWKNIIFAVILIILRLKNKQTNFPEDETIFRRQGRVTNQTVANQSIKKTDWNTAHRITKVLANETEYVTYFLILFLAYTVSPKTTIARQIIYGCTFLMSRYLHNSGLILRSTYARLIGFILTILVLVAVTFDLAITLSMKSKTLIANNS